MSYEIRQAIKAIMKQLDELEIRVTELEDKINKKQKTYSKIQNAKDN